MTTNLPKHRHVWVHVHGVDQLQPGLILAWRRTADLQWEAQVATLAGGGMRVGWTAVGDLVRLTDDRIDPN